MCIRDRDTVPAAPETNSACSADIIKNGLLLKLKTTLPIEEICSMIENSVNIKSYELLDTAQATSPTSQQSLSLIHISTLSH